MKNKLFISKILPSACLLTFFAFSGTACRAMDGGKPAPEFSAERLDEQVRHSSVEGLLETRSNLKMSPDVLFKDPAGNIYVNNFLRDTEFKLIALGDRRFIVVKKDFAEIDCQRYFEDFPRCLEKRQGMAIIFTKHYDRYFFDNIPRYSEGELRIKYPDCSAVVDGFAVFNVSDGEVRGNNLMKLEDFIGGMGSAINAERLDEQARRSFLKEHVGLPYTMNEKYTMSLSDLFKDREVLFKDPAGNIYTNKYLLDHKFRLLDLGDGRFVVVRKNVLQMDYRRYFEDSKWREEKLRWLAMVPTSGGRYFFEDIPRWFEDELRLKYPDCSAVKNGFAVFNISDDKARYCIKLEDCIYCMGPAISAEQLEGQARCPSSEEHSELLPLLGLKYVLFTDSVGNIYVNNIFRSRGCELFYLDDQTRFVRIDSTRVHTYIGYSEWLKNPLQGLAKMSTSDDESYFFENVPRVSDNELRRVHPDCIAVENGFVFYKVSYREIREFNLMKLEDFIGGARYIEKCKAV